MKFGPVPTTEAAGKILGHNIAAPSGRRAFRKGHALTSDDITQLLAIGRTIVYVAEIEPDDVDENEAAKRIATAVAGGNLTLSRAVTGRVNLHAAKLGVLRVDAARLAQVNACAGTTLATLLSQTAVFPEKMVGTVKILPYAIPESTVQAVEAIATTPLIHITPLLPRRASLILSGSPSTRERILKGFDKPLRGRLETLGSSVHSVDFVPLEDEQGEIGLARLLQQRRQENVDLIILAGETAVMDRHDIQPRAIERAGGHIECFGAPVDPGNLLVIAYLDGVPIMGAPGCARSPKPNIVDWVLPRLLAGDHLTHADIFALGHGGLLEDVAERPSPRRKVNSNQ
ncbi:MAG: molybdopterin-binding protein [Chloroflexota bacterium]